MALALNYLIAFLLLVTILYCWRLNRRIVELHKGKKELLTLLKAFDQSILRAEEGTKALKHSCANIGKLLQNDIERGKFLVEDLHFMIDRAASATDKLEKTIQDARLLERPASPLPPRPSMHETATRVPPRVSFHTGTEDMPNPMPHSHSHTEQRPKTGIELLLEKLAGRKENTESNRPAPADKRITYKTPDELGAFQVDTLSTADKAGNDLMKLLKST